MEHRDGQSMIERLQSNAEAVDEAIAGLIYAYSISPVAHSHEHSVMHPHGSADYEHTLLAYRDAIRERVADLVLHLHAENIGADSDVLREVYGVQRARKFAVKTLALGTFHEWLKRHADAETVSRKARELAVEKLHMVFPSCLIEQDVAMFRIESPHTRHGKDGRLHYPKNIVRKTGIAAAAMLRYLRMRGIDGQGEMGILIYRMDSSGVTDGDTFYLVPSGDTGSLSVTLCERRIEFTASGKVGVMLAAIFQQDDDGPALSDAASMAA